MPQDQPLGSDPLSLADARLEQAVTLFETVATPNHPLAPPKPAASGGSTLVDLLDSPLAAAPTFATAPALTPAPPPPHQAAASFAAGLFGMGAGAATPPAKGQPTLSRMPDGPGAASGERTALDEVLQQHPKTAELPAEAVDGAASGPAAVWQELAFADLFADVAGGSQAGQPGPGQPGPQAVPGQSEPQAVPGQQRSKPWPRNKLYCCRR